ncbi:anti-sigma factor family protein [Candidatus Eisenbacteria bacterium]|uniref:Anti-sigma factor family protein n=1 Tax=Eiseniibacteriota bacterium TaxID=2212470 RepID=A0ABV6YJ17_UNCEI
MRTREEHSSIPDLKLERFLLGELEPQEASRIRQELETDEALRERVETLRRSNQEVLERYPAPWMAAEIHKKAGQSDPARARFSKKSGRRSFWLVPALSMAAAAVFVLLILPPPGEWFRGEPAPPVVTRIKGLEPQILLFRKTETGSERLENGATVHEHDLILVRYLAAGKAHGAIISVDGKGTLTRHAPLEGTASLQLRQDEAVSLNFSYELDDAPRWEKFYFVTSDAPFDLDMVIRAVKEMISAMPVAGRDTLQLPLSMHQTIFTLRKETDHE